MKLIKLVGLILCFSILSACQSVGQSVATEGDLPTSVPSTTTPIPTFTPFPTNTSAPSETPTNTNTPMPEGVFFRDDFNEKLQPGWEWENENPSNWTITNDGWLQITGEQDSLLIDNHQSNLLWYSLPAGDFAITVHLKENPFINFQQAAIYIYEDPQNYVAINRGYCDVCATGGGGFYMEYKINGVWGAYTAATYAEDVYLKLESADNEISGFYATEPDKWVRIGRFGNYFQFKKVGIGVSNVGSAKDVVGLFDYFEIAKP